MSFQGFSSNIKDLHAPPQYAKRYTKHTFFLNFICRYSGWVDQKTTQLGCHPTLVPHVGMNPFPLTNTGNLKKRHTLTPKQKNEACRGRLPPHAYPHPCAVSFISMMHGTGSQLSDPRTCRVFWLVLIFSGLWCLGIEHISAQKQTDEYSEPGNRSHSHRCH